jgi:hypothetical protein
MVEAIPLDNFDTDENFIVYLRTNPFSQSAAEMIRRLNEES